MILKNRLPIIIAGAHSSQVDTNLQVFTYSHSHLPRGGSFIMTATGRTKQLTDWLTREDKAVFCLQQGKVWYKSTASGAVPQYI